ncbi:hypothetical protein F4859DRAFT_515429 [Xylaria cf. heliscus]|nr:hypothetical protein F4859DRAFT_515429 [Xylaria cf. heliscus]
MAKPNDIIAIVITLLILGGFVAFCLFTRRFRSRSNDDDEDEEEEEEEEDEDGADLSSKQSDYYPIPLVRLPEVTAVLIEALLMDG